MTTGKEVIKCMSFNQDYTCLAIGTSTGYKVFNCDPFGECFEKSDDGGASITEMLFATSLIGIVGLGDKSINSRRKLKIINTKRKVVICELTFPSPILLIKLNRKRLVVVISDQIFIYDVSCMKLLHTIETSATKPKSSGAIVELSSNLESILAFPSFDNSLQNSGKGKKNDTNQAGLVNSDPVFDGSNSMDRTIKFGASTNQGTVIIFNAFHLQPLNIIQAHKSPLQKIALSKDGSLIATASVKGTIIRVFRISDGKKLYEFRRGTYTATISCLSFSLNNSILACSSNTGTIHLFKLNEPSKFKKMPQQPQEQDMDIGTQDSLAETSEGSIDTNTPNSSSISRLTPEPNLEPTELPTESSLTDEENNELNNILNTNTFINGGYSSRRKKSVTDYLWSSAFSVTKSVRGKVNNYLPNTVTSMIDPKRDFAFIKLPNSVSTQETDEAPSNSNTGGINPSESLDGNGKSIESVVCVNENSVITVATKDGNFYVYTLPSMDKGGECVLLKQYKLT